MVDPFTQRFFVELAGGEKIEIYSLKLKHKDTVVSLFKKINLDAMLVNILTPEKDNKGSIKLNKGNIKFDDEAYRAMMELLEIATRLPREEVLKFDMRTSKAIIKKFMQISQLKVVEGNVKEPDYSSIYANFAQHTNISPKELLEYSLPEIEFLAQGFEKANEGEGGKRVLKGKEAIEFLKNKGL